MKIDYEQYIKDYFDKSGLRTELSTCLRDEWACLGRQYKNLDVDMFLSGLEVSCLEEEHQQYQLHFDRLAVKEAVHGSIECDILYDICDSILVIIKNCKDPGFIATCLKGIRQDWTDESSRTEMLKKYEIHPRKQIIAAGLAKMNGAVSGTSPSLFSEPKPNPGSSPGCYIVPSS